LVSHLPHVAAFSLISTVPDKYLPLAAGGLRDTTRIAASDSLIWEDIFFSNKDKLLSAITLFELNLKGIKNALKSNNRGALRRILVSARKKRESLA
jgi:prephenate dehydrogenase